MNRLPFYEANILSALVTSQSINFSFNLFEDEGIVEFFFDEVYSEIDDKEDLFLEVEGKKYALNFEKNAVHDPESKIMRS